MTAQNQQSTVTTPTMEVHQLIAKLNPKLELKLYKLQAHAEYHNGFLARVEGMEEMSKNAKDLQARLPFPYKIAELEQFKQAFPSLVFELVKVEVTPIAAKIAVFRKLYEAKIGRLTLTKQDRKDWEETFQNVPAIAEEIEFYLDTNEYPIKGNKCIRDFVRHYQDVKRIQTEQRNKANGVIQLPNHYDEKLYNQLGKDDPEQFVLYQKHLKSLGYEKKVAQSGATIFSKPQTK